jgi:hypothetical protein
VLLGGKDNDWKGVMPVVSHLVMVGKPMQVGFSLWAVRKVNASWSSFIESVCRSALRYRQSEKAMYVLYPLVAARTGSCRGVSSLMAVRDLCRLWLFQLLFDNVMLVVALLIVSRKGFAEVSREGKVIRLVYFSWRLERVMQVRSSVGHLQCAYAVDSSKTFLPASSERS